MNSSCSSLRSCLACAALTLLNFSALAQDNSLPEVSNDFPGDLPVVSISSLSTVLESCPPNAGCAGIQFYLRRTSPGLERPLTVFVRYRGTATADIDYPALPGMVTFEAGRDSAAAASIPTDDTLYEGDETVIAEVIPLADYYVDPNRWQATTILRDNDPPAPPVVSLGLVQRDAMETRIDQNAIFWAEFRVLRTGPATDELVVFLNTRQGSARLGEDYWLDGVNNGSTVRIPAGTNSVNVRLYPIDDDFYEGDETMFFHLIAPPPASDPYEIELANSSVSMVIHDNDPVTTRLDITSPREGQQFQAGDVIELRAQIIGPGSDDGLWSIEFFDGEQRIGTTQPGGAIFWRDAGGGPHVINARAYHPAWIPGQDTLDARPVNIFVGPGPAWPVVSLTTPHWPFDKTSEPCPVCFVVPGVLIISRTGAAAEPLTVYLEADGTAAPGADYQPLPHSVTIPAGTNSAYLLVLPFDDQLVEGPEVVRASIARPPELANLGYLVNMHASEAFVVIGDDEAGAPEARLDIIEPPEGAQFALGSIIQISALGVYTRGEVFRPVEFYAGDTLIGRSSPEQPLRPSIPGLPSIHTILWTNPPPGQHVLTARSQLSLNEWVQAPPRHITVGGGPTQSVIRIEATQPIAEEDSTPFDRLNLVGVFTISRTGPTNQPAGVFVQYSGTATAGKDYPLLPWLVTIPEGATSTQIRVEPFADGIPEGIETLIATISDCPPVTDPTLGMPCLGPPVDPAHESATVFIRDDGTTRASLTITRPKDGAKFNVGETLLIEATAIDLDSYISRVEFWDGERKIGVSEIVFIRPPDPGTPVDHSFEWFDAAPGGHALTARAVTSAGKAVSSAPVHIAVGPTSNQPPRIAISRPASGTEFPLDTAIEIVADTRDPDGYVPKVEFFADGRKIGEASVVFIRPPDPNQPQTFAFVWRQATPGSHALTARATDDDGGSATSAPTEIKVGTSEPLPIVTVTAPDPFAVEPRSNSVLNAASFRIRRFGPTNDALLVAYSLHGTAGNGIDYETLPGLAMIPAGGRSATIVVRPFGDDLSEGVETVRLRVEPPPLPNPEIPVIHPYRVGRPRAALALISDGPWLHAPGDARCVPLPGGLRHLCFAAEAGQNFRVEASDDLRNWETLFDTLAGGDGWHFVDDKMANHPQRYYRLRPEPVVEADE